MTKTSAAFNSSPQKAAESEITHDILQALQEFDTTILANTLGYLDAPPIHEWYMSGDIAPITPGVGPTVGVAVTCQIDSSTPGGKPEMDLYWKQVAEIESMDVPVIWVVQAVGSRPDHECIMGDGMAKMLFAAGCLGSVMDGRARDVAGMMTVPFAVYARGVCVHHCVVRVKEINKPVSVGGITIEPGEVIHAGCEGVIKVPRANVEELILRAPKMVMAEKELHVLWRQTDISVAEKRKHHADVFAQYGFTV